ncbi:MAG TPA: SCO family protein [Methylomirabilota bacterium]|jgi:cytochrome oxidase Cu insertion factor (SCO1/SenC/PrrC family)|nr:SCO family protein [Methylomirabilota bacterium]
MRRGLRAFALLAGVAGGLLATAPLSAHEALSLEDEFVKGVFSPAFTPPAAGSYELPAVKRVPGVVLKDLAGRPVSTRHVTAGKVAVVSFIYTTCPERLGCPLASLALQELQAKLKDEGLSRHAMLLSISFDPVRDTPGQLAKYARIYGADPRLWRFMTAPSERALDHVLDSYGQDRAAVYDEQGRFTGRYRHVLKVFLVDPAGYIRNVYSAGFLVPDLVLNDIKTVLGESAPREVVRR